jgi:beta-N-acetylhexosaminidase
MTIIDRANERIARFKAQYAQAPTGLESIRSDEHLAVAREAARRGSALLKHREGLLPLAQDQHIALVEFASVLDSDAVEKGDMTGLAALCHERFPQIESVAMKVFEPDPEHVERALNLAERCDLLVLATRNAHLYPSEADLARMLLDAASKSILICLRNPYDAAVLTANVVIATCGDATPSLEAVVAILAGEFVPDHHLAVTVDLI